MACIWIAEGSTESLNMYNVPFTMYKPHPTVSPSGARGATQHPTYAIPYLYNASNRQAQAFYKAQGIEAKSFEIGTSESAPSLRERAGGEATHPLFSSCNAATVSATRWGSAQSRANVLLGKSHSQYPFPTAVSSSCSSTARIVR